MRRGETAGYRLTESTWAKRETLGPSCTESGYQEKLCAEAGIPVPPPEVNPRKTHWTMTTIRPGLPKSNPLPPLPEASTSSLKRVKTQRVSPFLANLYQLPDTWLLEL